MAVSASSSASLLNSLSSLALSSSPPPQPITVSLTPASSCCNAWPLKTLEIRQALKTPVIPQVIAYPDESEESLVGRFRREVFRANILQESKRRRFFETNQEKRKRKIRDAARRRARRKPRPMAKKEEVPKKKVADDENDNWEPIDGEVPYC